jgi:hypothetical protein
MQLKQQYCFYILHLETLAGLAQTLENKAPNNFGQNVQGVAG